MAKYKTKVGSYQDYLDAVAVIGKAKDPEKIPKLIAVYGSSDFLINRFCMSLKTKWHALDGGHYSALEATSLGSDLLESLWQQAGLFEPQMLYVIRRCEKKSDLWKLLKEAPSTERLLNHLCFVVSSDSLNAKIRGELKRLNAVLIPCFNPKPYEMGRIVELACRRAKLDLSKSAADIVLEAVGADMARLENEINKLALIFAGEKRRLESSDVAGYLGMLREDHTFKLTDLLLSGHFAAAYALVADLIRRGERIEKIIGLLALHCRNALFVKDLKQNGGATSSYGTGVSPWIVKRYTQYVSSTSSIRFLQALQCCREADLRLKSTRISGEVLVASVIDALAGR